MSSVGTEDASNDGRDRRRAFRQTNAYLVWDGRSPDALVLDPGMGAAGPLMEPVAASGPTLHLVANSHGHIDHIFDNAALMRASGAPLAIHPDDPYRLVGDNNYGFEIEPSVETERELPWMRRIAETGRLLIPG